MWVCATGAELKLTRVRVPRERPGDEANDFARPAEACQSVLLPTVKSRDFYLQRDVTRRELWRKSWRRRAKKKRAQCASPDTKYETVRSKGSH